MDRRIQDYVLNSDKRIVSPIGGGIKAFEFMCMDFVSIAESLGFAVEHVSDHLRVIKEGQLENRKQLDDLINGRRPEQKFFQWEYEYLSMMSEWDYFDFYGGGCFGPLTIAGSILGVSRMLKMIVKEPDFVEDLVKYITDVLIDLARKEKEIGMDFFWIAEPDASLISPKQFWRFSGQYIKKIFKAADETGFLHVCGNTLKHTLYLQDTGAKVISIDFPTDIRACLEMVDSDTIIMGNASPITLRYGTYDDVAAEVELMLESCRGYRNYVVSTGCSIIEDTPEEHVELLREMAEQDKILNE